MCEENLPSIIEAVEFRREQYGLTRRQWAALLGIEASHYTEFTKGRRNLTIAHAAKAYEFGVPAEALFQCKKQKNMTHIRKIAALMGWKL